MEKTRELTVKDLIEVFKDYIYFLGQLQELQNRLKSVKDGLFSLEKECSEMEKKVYEKESMFKNIAKQLV